MKTLSLPFLVAWVLMSRWCVATEPIKLIDSVVQFGSVVQVPSLSDGRIASVDADDFTTVLAGAPLATLDDQSLLIKRRAAKLRVELARETAQNEVERRYAEVALAEAREELENSRSIQADVRGVIAQTQMRRMRLTVQRGELEVARAEKLQSRAHVEWQLRQADLAEIEDQIDLLTIQSPIDGIVIRSHREAGEWVGRGQPVATVARIDRLRVQALARADRLTPGEAAGARVAVQWDEPKTGQSNVLSGKVVSVDPQTLLGGKYRIAAMVENRRVKGKSDRWLLRPGVEVELSIYPPAASPPFEASNRSVSRSRARDRH